MNDPCFPGPEGKLNPLHLQLRAPRSHGSDRAWGLMLGPGPPPRRPRIRANTLPFPLQQRPWRSTSKTAKSHSPCLRASKKTCWIPGKEQTMEHFGEKTRGNLLETGRHCCSFHQPIQSHRCPNKLLQTSTHTRQVTARGLARICTYMLHTHGHSFKGAITFITYIYLKVCVT